VGLGVGRGDFVVMMVPTSLDVIRTWFGISLAGAVDVPLNIAYKGPTLVHGVNLSEARVMVVDPQFLPRLADVEDQLSSLEVVVTIAPTDHTLRRVRVVALEDLDEAPLPDLADLRHSDTASVLFTSGTTGPAKGVVF